ncbi:hypothetical protein SOHN41_00666 [Shewanella sp. HN-41]|nr:hypothetical protein SOHN41_00666 [Shewanella sp. HN-41]
MDKARGNEKAKGSSVILNLNASISDLSHSRQLAELIYCIKCIKGQIYGFWPLMFIGTHVYRS